MTDEKKHAAVGRFARPSEGGVGYVCAVCGKVAEIVGTLPIGKAKFAHRGEKAAG